MINKSGIQNSEDYYTLLKVNVSSSKAKIKASYKNLAKIYHPDLSSGNTDKMSAINKAYDTLSNLHKRKKYDQQLSIYSLRKTKSSFTYKENRVKKASHYFTDRQIMVFNIFLRILYNPVVLFAAIFIALLLIGYLSSNSNVNSDASIADTSPYNSK